MAYLAASSAAAASSARTTTQAPPGGAGALRWRFATTLWLLFVAAEAATADDAAEKAADGAIDDHPVGNQTSYRK